MVKQDYKTRRAPSHLVPTEQRPEQRLYHSVRVRLCCFVLFKKEFVPERNKTKTSRGNRQVSRHSQSSECLTFRFRHAVFLEM